MPRNQTHDIVIQSMYTALLRLMDEKPYREISIKDIIVKAGVSRMAFYRNYTDKSEILLTHYREILATFSERCQHTGRLTERSLFRGLAAALLQDPVLRYIYRADLMLETFTIQKELALDLFARVLGWDAEDPGVQMVVYGRMGALSGVLLYIVEHPAYADLDAITEYVLSLAPEEAAREHLAQREAPAVEKERPL